MTAARLAARIAELEKETAEAWAAIETAEKDLAQVLAEGGDKDKAHAALTKARDLATGSVRALVQMDRQYFDLATAEYEKAIEDYNGTMGREFQKIGFEAEKVMKPLERVLASAFPDPAAKLSELHDNLLREVWAGLQAVYSAKYSQMVPTPPASVTPRNSYGRHLTPAEANAGFSSPYKFEHGPEVVQTPSPPIRQWWKE